MQIKIESAIRPAMNRVLDVEKLGGMDVGEGSFALQVIDPLCPWNEGAWLFESGGGKLQVRKTSKAECQLKVQGLTALVAGTHDSQDLSLRDWGNPNPVLQSKMCEMFPKKNPFMHENF